MNQLSAHVEQPALSEKALFKLQKSTFGYFLKESNPANGMVPDNTRENSAASIAAIGFALTAYPIAVEREYLTRAKAVKRVLTTLRFFWNSHQGKEPHATGYKGFYYHFLDMQTGARANNSELSTIDTTFLLAGALTAGAYFDGDAKDEQEIRTLADALYARADWQWALNRGRTVAHAWKPERKFVKHRWEGYSEALILYLLALASPTYPVPAKSYAAWASTYRWEKLYDIEFLYAGPLFIHPFSHLWVDFRGIQDEFMRAKGIDYFENSRRAAYVHQQYAIRNPKKFKGYGEYAWGITASEGPGPAARRINGIKRRFYDYRARSIPDGPDDGTLAPWAVVASLPFAPEIVLPSIKYFDDAYPEMTSEYGFKCSYNPTYGSNSKNSAGWISEGYYGLDQGADCDDDRKLSFGLRLALDEEVPAARLGLAPRGIHHRLARRQG
ncbi:MAG: glucoamylase family protein [Pyrinomonadaceae bacterium]